MRFRKRPTPTLRAVELLREAAGHAPGTMYAPVSRELVESQDGGFYPISGAAITPAGDGLVEITFRSGVA